jgi:hypothetical protein
VQVLIVATMVNADGKRSLNTEPIHLVFIWFLLRESAGR